MIADILEFYSKAPWFLPIEQIRIVGSDEMVKNFIEHSQEFNTYNLSRLDVDTKKISQIDVGNCRLFSSTLKKKGTGINWEKFLNLEIGKKRH